MGWDTDIIILAEKVNDDKEINSITDKIFEKDAKSYGKSSVFFINSNTLIYHYERRKYAPYWIIQEISKEHKNVLFTILASCPEFLGGPAGLIRIKNGDITDSYGINMNSEDAIRYKLITNSLQYLPLIYEWFGYNGKESALRIEHLPNYPKGWCDENFVNKIIPIKETNELKEKYADGVTNPETFFNKMQQEKTTKKVQLKIKEAKIQKSSLLSLNAEGLHQIPKEVFELEHLTNLNLRGNSLTSLPKEISKLKQLKVIYLDGNNITEIPAELFDLKHLTVLNLSNNSLKSIPNNIGSCTSLKRLHLSKNNIIKLPESIGKLHHLEHLYCYANKLTEVPKEIGDLKKLLHLNFFNNQIQNFDFDVSNLTSLKYLELSFNNIENISETIGNLKKLEILSLYENSLKTIPKTLNKLTQLIRLNVSFNNIKEIDFDLNSMKKLAELHIFSNKGLEIKKLDIEALCNRTPYYSGHSRLLIDQTQLHFLNKLQRKIESSKIGVVDLEKKQIPEGHYKQIPLELSQKYQLTDPRHEKFRATFNRKSKN
ncbi:leucine-rich repeat domain-containing protein [Tenacibaculum sp. M341]|uniref:leucine-rich repeat domain-containing protein n=1 Tax=Tenacibaculum sp. M341 TaxID=2530339 RepID=UPI00104F9FE6|nr:leucine-rich repeat domain-containing protein [Tenacibaculum sp. M341]TCI89999.1 hypothetical protein EYW44_15140 [Tenacibaculum sp. M341]